MEYDGLHLDIPKSVYPPAEDSLMLAKGAKGLKGLVLEIGCGCGIASLSCAKAGKGNRIIGIDINPDAARCAAANAENNKITNARFLAGDMFAPIKDAVFDAIMFNPPYLPTSDDERLPGDINHAYDGGADGRLVLDRFLSGFDPHLKRGGTLLLIQSSLNDKGKTCATFERMGYAVTVLAEESFFFERLYLIEAKKRV
ncbi:MAG: HemK2/MTQ2 family protein methyltransferase [Candidatus Micrarchaeota archaeon]